MVRSTLRLFFGTLALGTLALVAGCDTLSLSGDTTFTGVVVDGATSEPIEGAAVRAGGLVDTTDADGRYDLTLEVDSTDQAVVLSFSAAGYTPRTVTARADVNGEVNVGVTELTAIATGGGGTGSGAAGPATSVTLAQRSTEVVGVTGAGGLETATLEFVAVDDQGRPVGAANAVDLTFVIASGPGGGEILAPATATTGDDGRADVTLTSGTRAGTVQVLATGTVDGREIRSLPVTITITGGLPDDAHFSVASTQLNFAGYNIYGLTNAVTAYVGDKYGNPVQPGTAVYFTTDGGIIPGSGVTNDQGTTTVDLLSAAPGPSNPVGCSSNPNGYGVVTASTSDENQARIEDSVTVLFSGVTQITPPDPAGLYIGPYSFSVADQFGHPLAPGTTISVAAEGVNIKATGDANVTLGDFLCPGAGRTDFRFSIAKDDPSVDADDPVLESITITVTSPNGNARLTRTATGRTAATRTPASARDVFERLDADS